MKIHQSYNNILFVIYDMLKSLMTCFELLAILQSLPLIQG